MNEVANERRGRGVGLAWRLLLALVVTAAALRAALPWALGALIESRATESLGRLVRIGNVDVELLAGALALEQVAIGPIFQGAPPETLDPDTAHFRCDRLAVHWSWLALLEREIRIESLELDAPKILLVRAEDGDLVPVLRPRDGASPGTDDPASQGESAEEPAEGWPVAVENLRITELEAYYLNLARPERRPVEFDFEALSLEDLSVRGDEIALGPVALQAPRLRVLRDLDLGPFVAADAEEVAEGAGAEGSAPPPGGASRPRHYHLAAITLERADFTLVTNDGSEIAIAIELHARDVSSRRDARFPLELRLGLGGGTLALDGALGLSPLAFEGSLAWSDLPLHSVDEATGGALPLRIASGISSGRLAVDALVSDDAALDPSRIDLSGRLDVRNLDLSSEDGAVALAWTNVEIDADAVALRPDSRAPPRIELARVRIDDPSLAATLTGDAGPADEAPEEPTDARADPAARPVLRLARFDLANGRVTLVDERIEPPLRNELTQLEVSARDVRWPEREVSYLEARGRGPGGSRLHTGGALRDGDGRIEFDLEQLGLAELSPYAERGAGYRIESGVASLNAEARLDGDRVELESRFKLDRLDVDELRKGGFQREFGVPLDLALAVLRDPKGRIARPVDVAIERGQSAVGLRRVVLGALRQALVGALSSPLKGLKLVVPGRAGGGSPALAVLASEPGEVPLADPSEVGRLAEVLTARPGIRLVLHGQVGPTDDPAIAEQILAEAAAGDGQLPPVSAPRRQRKRVRAAVEARARGEAAPLEPEDEALLERWVAAVEVPAARREALAVARAGSLRGALIAGGSPEERVSLGESREGEPGVAIELAPVGR
jgi:hypothetical protein